jgi:hypothetical protein
MKRIILVILISFFWSSTLSAQELPDSLSSKHLIIKTDILFPIAYLISPENTSSLITLAVEYKINRKFSLQLSGSFFLKTESNDDSGGYFFVPEGRYFLKHHFVGIYTKAGLFKHAAYVDPYHAYSKNDRYLAIGGLYGYQRDIGRFNIEARIGFGIAKEYYKTGPAGNGSFNFTDDDPYLDAILGINVGYRIF